MKAATASIQHAVGRGLRHGNQVLATVDMPLLICAFGLLVLGLVMVGSASIAIADRELGNPFYYLIRQGIFVLAGVGAASLVLQLPMRFWERIGPYLIIVGVTSLLLVLLVGREVNGSTRWITMGPVNLQVSEFVKLALIVYTAGYLIRHGEAVRNTAGGFLKPMLVVSLIALLCLQQPDYGASAVMLATAMGMMFFGGVRLWLFGLLGVVAASSLTILVLTSSYRMKRFAGFLDPWADPFNSGFQLTQALIAFGRGEWLGVGLGGSVQKLFYLPEAHTDFVFSVMAEELGLLGVSTIVFLFSFMLWRIFRIARLALEKDKPFGAFLCYGIGLWIAMQAFINMGVNMGLLPTKGLTLPLMSYGGSSMLVMCVAIAMVLQVDRELRGVFPAKKRDKA